MAYQSSDSNYTDSNDKLEEEISTWKKEELPNIISKLTENQIHEAIVAISNCFNKNKEKKERNDEEMSSFKVKLKYLLNVYTQEIDNKNRNDIDFENSVEDIKKLFNLHNRSIHFVKTFIEEVKRNWKEQKKDFEDNKPKKRRKEVTEVPKAVGKFFPIYSPIITLISIPLEKVEDQILHRLKCKELLEKIELLYQDWGEVLVKCAVDILYSYEEYLFKAKTIGDVANIAINAATRVSNYSPGNNKDLKPDECYKELLKTLISAKGNGLKANFDFDNPSQKQHEVELEIDGIFAKAPVFISGNGYRRVTKGYIEKLLSLKSGKWKYGCRRKFKCPEVEALYDNESSVSDNDISYCFDKKLTCNYQWEFDLNDENSFETCKKYLPCPKDSSEILTEILNHLQNMPEHEENKKLIENIIGLMQQNRKEIDDKIEEVGGKVIKNVTENGKNV